MALSKINTNQIVDGAVATADIADGLITTAKLADGAVTTAKITDGNITTAKVANDAITTAKVNPTQTDITQVGTLTSFASTGIDDNADANALTIDSNEKVGIGTASPQDPLHTYLASGQRVARFEANSSTSAHIAFKANNTSLMPTIGVKDEDLYFSTGDAVERARFDADSNGDLILQTGNLVIGTSGKGIDFSASTDTSATGASATSELLSDYEEGTWTPYFLTGHSYGPAYAEQFGRYVRIGNLINAQYWIRMSGTLHSDGSAVRIAGLPYVLGKSGSENPDTYARGLGSIGYQDYNNNVPVPYGDNGLSTFSLFYDSNTSWKFGSNGSTHGGGKYFIGGITYTVDM